MVAEKVKDPETKVIPERFKSPKPILIRKI